MFGMEALQIMQNKAARLVTHSDLRTSRKTIFSQVEWMTVSQLVFYHSALSGSGKVKNLNILNRNNRADKIIIPNTNLTL